jgi:hypothetical protein
MVPTQPSKAVLAGPPALTLLAVMSLRVVHLTSPLLSLVAEALVLHLALTLAPEALALMALVAWTAALVLHLALSLAPEALAKEHLLLVTQVLHRLMQQVYSLEVEPLQAATQVLREAVLLARPILRDVVAPSLVVFAHC